MWNNRLKYDFEVYYQTYLVGLKYLLGYSSEAYTLAKQLKLKNKNIP